MQECNGAGICGKTAQVKRVCPSADSDEPALLKHQQSGFDPFLAHSMGFIQLSVKIADSEINGGARYRAWAHHRERVLERLGGWQLIVAGPDYATFNIPQSVVLAAASERQAKIPKEERRYWGDKADFCRCLETVLNEMEPRADKASAPSAYQLFCQDKRLEHKEQGHATLLEAKDLGSMWRGLSDEERKPWVEKSDELKSSVPAMGLPRKRSKSKSNGGIPCHVPVHPLPGNLQQVCSENGLDNIDLVVRLIEAKQVCPSPDSRRCPKIMRNKGSVQKSAIEVCTGAFDSVQANGQPMELMHYERRLRGIMFRLHELQSQIAMTMPPPKKQAKVFHPVEFPSVMMQGSFSASTQAVPQGVSGMYSRATRGLERERERDLFDEG